MFSFESRIRYSEVDKDCKLTLASLLNYFQDCSTFHSETVGYGVEYLANHKQAWIVMSWQIVVKEMPHLMDEVVIETEPYEMKAFYGRRSFAMRRKSGEVLAYANSVWALVDLSGEKPVPTVVPQDMIDGFTLGEPFDYEMEKIGRKLKMPEGMEEMDRLTVPADYIDSNGHMNNQKYIQVAENYLPQDFQTGEIRVEYKTEAKLGDEIVVSVLAEDDRVSVALNDVHGKTYALVIFIRKDMR